MIVSVVASFMQMMDGEAADSIEKIGHCEQLLLPSADVWMLSVAPSSRAK